VLVLRPHMVTPGRREYARSVQMSAILREAFLYSEKRARDCVFQAAENALANLEIAPTLASLIRLALEGARVHAKSIQYDLLNSETVTRAVFNAMLQAGVLLGTDRQPIPVDLRAYASPVSSLAPDFRNETESFLLEFLVAALGDVRTRDHLSLAHVLFRQFDPAVPMADLEDRLVMLFARLSDRIELSPSGTYVIRDKRSYLTVAEST